MADLFKLPKLEPQPSGVLKQTLVGAVNVSGGAADAGKVVLLNAAGQIDSSMGGGGGSSVKVNSASVSNPNFNNTLPAAPGGFTNVIWQVDPITGNVSAYYAASGTEIQVNGIDTTAQTPVSFVDSSTIHVTNPSAGNIQFTLSPPMPTVPVTNAGALHEFFKSYDSTIGVFGLGQPAFTDLSDYSAGTASPTLASVIFKGASVGSVTVQAPASLSPPTWTLTLPGNAGSAGWVLQTDGSGVTSWVAATGGAPGLPFNSIQFNNAGTFGGSSNFTYDGSTIVTLAGTMNANVFAVGTLGFVDTHILESLQTNTNSYVQAIIQNTNAGAAASADLIVANNNTTASTFYGDFGINSSGWTGVGGSYNLPNAVYLSATSGDLVIGTTTANAIHFFVNGGATDAMLIDGTTGGVTALVSLTTPQVNVKGATSGVVTIQSLTGTWSLTLPANAGGAGNLLTTDGAGVTSWVSPGASTLPGRQTTSTGALTIDANKITTTTIILAKKFALEKVVSITSPPCPVRVRLYSTAAAMNADTGTAYPATNVLSTSDRPNFIPPTPGTQHGVIADLYLDTSDKYNGWNMSPVAEGCNLDGSPSTSIYIAITNIDTVTRAQNVSLTYVAGES